MEYMEVDEVVHYFSMSHGMLQGVTYKVLYIFQGCVLGDHSIKSIMHDYLICAIWQWPQWPHLS